MKNIKQDFPILGQKIHEKNFVYLDSGATCQKPQSVLQAYNYYYQHDHANVHRGVHELSRRATLAYENTRRSIQKFIHAKHTEEIIFTSGTTESINLVVQSYGRSHFKAGDEIILTEMEHHSNIVPWQLLQDELAIQIKVIPIFENGELDLDYFKKILTDKTKFIALTHISNVLGTVNPLKDIISLAHAKAIPVLIDGAQAVSRLPIDVQDLDCDFYAFSSHKMYGPTGVGILYGKKSFLENMRPYQGGGSMIQQVSFEKTTYCDIPHKFEAGTPNIASIVAFDAAVRYIQTLGMPAIQTHEKNLIDYAVKQLQAIPGLRLLGEPKHKVGMISFVLDNIHPHDISTILDRCGIAVRAGHHCAMPLIKFYNIPACVRVSFGVYNTLEDIDALVSGLAEVRSVFHG